MLDSYENIEIICTTKDVDDTAARDVDVAIVMLSTPTIVFNSFQANLYNVECKNRTIIQGSVISPLISHLGTIALAWK